MGRIVRCIVAVALIGPAALAGQGAGKIQGVVRDGASQRPVARASVLIPGTTFRTTTGMDGAYVLDSVPAGVVSVRATYVGYKPREAAGVRTNAGMTFTEDFMLESSPVTLREIAIPSSVVLRFQLIRPIAVRTTDKAIMPIDSALHDLFQWPGYQLLSQTAITTDMPTRPEWGGAGGVVLTQAALNVDGEPYELAVQIDEFDAPQRVKMTVSLVSLRNAATGTSRGSAATAAERKAVFRTTVTVGAGRTVVLGSAQPSGGRGGMNGTLILTVRPEMRPAQ